MFYRDELEAAFREACHAHDYAKTLYYLDLRRMPAQDRAKNLEAAALLDTSIPLSNAFRRGCAGLSTIVLS